MQQSRYYQRIWKILALSTGKCWALIDTTMFILERVKGIEPSYAAWEAAVLPLNYTRVLCDIPHTILARKSQPLLATY